MLRAPYQKFYYCEGGQEIADKKRAFSLKLRAL
jgi:hypothetical protein